MGPAVLQLLCVPTTQIRRTACTLQLRQLDTLPPLLHSFPLAVRATLGHVIALRDKQV